MTWEVVQGGSVSGAAPTSPAARQIPPRQGDIACNPGNVAGRPYKLPGGASEPGGVL